MSGSTNTSHAGDTPAPHNLEAEESVLGAMLLSKEAIASVVGRIESDDFYRPAHKYVFDAIMSIYDETGDSVDPITVADRLEGEPLEKLGGPAALITLQSRVPAIGHAAKYADIVRQHAVRRRMVLLGAEMRESGQESSEETVNALTGISSEIHSMIIRSRGEEELSAVQYSAEALDSFVERWTGSSGGASSGFRDLDKLIDGLHPGRSYILGARPSMGKSALALNIACKVAFEDDRPVAFFSIEMDGKEVAQRAIMSRALISSQDMTRGNLLNTDWLRLKSAQKELSSGKLVIDPSPVLTIRDIYAKCRQIRAAQGDLGLVVVDYIGIMSSSGQRAESRQLEISDWSRELKKLSKELGVPVLILAQLSRQLENRMDKRPLLSDLRESGSLEQDADVVMFMYRDEKYTPGSTATGFAEVIVAKNRHGASGTAILAFLESMTRFANLPQVA